MAYQIVSERGAPQLIAHAKECAVLLKQASYLLQQPLADDPGLLMAAGLFHESVVKTRIIKGRQFCVSDTQAFDDFAKIFNELFPLDEQIER